MPMQCHCHNWLHPNSQKTMSSQMFTTSAFFLDFFKYLILYLIMLRSHSSRILKEKYELIWNVQQNYKLCEGGSPSSICFWTGILAIVLLLYLSYYYYHYSSLHLLHSFLFSSFSFSFRWGPHAIRDTFITTRVWSQKLWILLAAAVF